MTAKAVKEEARRKLALNMHQSIAIYTVEFSIFITLVALVVLSCVSLSANKVLSVIMICYGILLGIIVIVAAGMLGFAMTDFYLAAYRCKPYNIRRLGETLARSNITKILTVSLKRTVLAFLLLLCLIVPGVIYLMRTSMANYLLVANPKMKPSTALTASSKVMSGKTGSYFVLCLSLAGWYVLGVVTLGLGFIFISPYLNLVKTVFYKRNLQGDKAEYAPLPQTFAFGAAPGVQYPSTSNGQAQYQGEVQPVQQPARDIPNGPSPIDTLADDDFMDMNAAMRDLNGKADEKPPEASLQDIPEVPIMPVVGKNANEEKKSAAAENIAEHIKEDPPVIVAEPVAAEPVIVQPVIVPEPVTAAEQPVAAARDASAAEQPETPQTPQSDPIGQTHKLDGTNIVETERTLTTKEIAQSDIMRKQAIDRMYNNTEQGKPLVNYFDVDVKKHDDFDDFGTGDSDTSQPQPTNGTGNGFGNTEPVMSESEFDEFLRKFDSETSAVQSDLKTPRASRRTSERRAADLAALRAKHSDGSDMSDPNRYKRDRR